MNSRYILLVRLYSHQVDLRYSLFIMTSIRKNYFFNLTYQIFSLLTPLITAPYISRVLGSVGVGKYALSYTIATYFILVGSLGFGYYAQREVASLQNNKYKQSKLFWEILIARSFTIAIVLILYFALYFVGAFGDYSSLMLVWSVYIISTIFDISFFFEGNDKFGVLAFRNMLIRTIGIIIIFIFIKDKDDVEKYALYQAIISVIANLSLWPHLGKSVFNVNIKNLNIKQHVMPTIKLFIPTLAVSVYTMLDRLFIGLLIPGTTEIMYDDGTVVVAKIADVENGFYEQSEKIVKLIMTLFTSLTTVMVTRNSFELASGNMTRFKNNIDQTLKYLLFIGVPMMFGISAISINFCPWFFGSGYDKVPYLIMMFSPIILIIGFSNVLGRQYLIPLKRDNAFTMAICMGAVMNLLLNFILVPWLFSYGAAIASVIAEIVVTSFMLYMARNDISLRKLFISSWKYFFAGILMFISIYTLSVSISPSVLSTLLLTFLGGTIYISTLVVLKEHFVNFYIIQKLKKMI